MPDQLLKLSILLLQQPTFGRDDDGKPSMIEESEGVSYYPFCSYRNLIQLHFVYSIMKVVAALIVSAATASAFVPATFGVRSTALNAEFDLEFGKKNDYEAQSYADGGQGQFGAVSPNDWRVPGTSPVGQSSYAGAPDGGDEPWFSEAVSTVSLDLAKAEETLKAFTKEAAEFKIAAFCEDNDIKDKSKAMADLVGSMGYDKFLESSPGQLKKAYEKLTGAGKEKE